MNNLTFRATATSTTRRSRAGRGQENGFDGTDVVQTHMTNSRLTDPEVLEWRFPVRLDSYEIRRGSGGEGRYCGGSGGRRRLRFLEPMTATILSSHRRVAPYGMAGVVPGRSARSGSSAPTARSPRWPVATPSRSAPGDLLVVETPGGGRYGASQT